MKPQAFNPRYLAKLAASLFEESDRREAFESSFSQVKKEKSCLVWTKPKPSDFNPAFELAPFIQSENLIVDFVVNGSPGRSQWHEDGYFYLLDYSSVIAGLTLTGISTAQPKVLDLCASPGGKSILASRILSPSLLVCNESINGRVRMLISNLKRCDITPSGVWSADVGYLAQKFSGLFDVVLVDAPCSGQSLLVKGEKNPGAFNPLTIQKNASRQKRIVSAAYDLLAPGGYLAYMTCTYAKEENEEVIDWLTKKKEGLKAIAVEGLIKNQSHLAAYPAYRVWPQDQLGAGSFSALLQKQVGDKGVDCEFPYIWKNGI